MSEQRSTNPDELGALWSKSGARGDYMTGTIGGQKVVVFKNDRKTSEKQPDWRIFKAKPREELAVVAPVAAGTWDNFEPPF